MRRVKKGKPATPIHPLLWPLESHPVLVMIILGLITLLFGLFALDLRVDPEVLRLLPADSETIRRIEEHGEAIKDVDYYIVVLSARDPFTIQGLRAIRQATERIEALEPILGSITPLNLVTVRSLRGAPIFLPLSEGGVEPTNEIELEEFRSRALADPLAAKRVVSQDGKSFSLVFPIRVLPDYRSFLEDVEEILPILRKHYQTRIAGWIPLNETTRSFILRDPPILIVIAVAISLCVFLLSFGSLRALLLPLISIAGSLIWTFGLMALWDIPLTILGVMIAPLVFALGSSYGIHILNQFYRNTAGGGRKVNLSVSHSVGEVIRTIVLAALTTAAGFGSLALAAVQRVREFGIFTALGVIICALLSLMIYPAILGRLKPPRPRQQLRVLTGRLTRLTRRLGASITRYRYLVLLSMAVTLLGFGLVFQRVRFETDFTSFYRGKVDALEDNRSLMKDFGSFMDINLTVTAPEGEADYFLDMQVLKKIDRFETEVRQNPNVSDVLSFLSYARAVNYALEGEMDLPERRGALLFLVKGLEALRGPAEEYVRTFVGEGFGSLTFRIYFYNGETRDFLFEEDLRILVDFVNEKARQILPSEINPEIWGWNLVALELSRIFSRDQLVSILASAGIVFFITSLAFRSIRFGLFALTPLAVGVMLNIIFMWLVGIHFDVLTVMFSAIAIGIGVDDSIHMIIRYRQKETITDALETAGRPIILTSLTVFSGFAALLFSSFLPVARFGLLISTALLFTTLVPW